MNDPGLQPERTWLAWKRTVLSQGVCAALLLHAAVESGRGPVILPALLASGAVCATYLVAHRAHRRLRATGTPQQMPAGLLAMVSALTMLTALTTVLLWL
ncbi:MAG: DUF202 domain-containing protein [Actinophytocola sp.]|uniref:DUF202 domain-containing protein n=1 Tax=Actinophytocola sp. TaxID=1872138 RepID=UPI0013232823|nr:DUF202 domain-containing protein [Actinophytocola sp.]MPZ84301.1 DUF202 domain-containing protein [Actinophytocola sp.]